MSTPTVPLAVDVPPAAAPRRPRGRAALAVLAVLVVAAAGVDVLGDVTATRTATTEVFDGPVRQVRAEGGTGDVRVTAADVARVQVRALVHEGWTDAGASAALADGVLRLDSSCESGWWSPCEVSWEVEVPEGVDLALRTGTGDQKLSGRFGRVGADVGTGDVEASGADADEVDVRAGTGDVELGGAYREVRVRTGTGDVEVDVVQPPDSVELTTGTGDVDLQLPDVEGGYAAGATSSFGDVVLDLPVDDDSPRAVRVTASTGDVEVLTR
ncbi:DUF4097 family beta strand repeat-containing protein [Kineococcus gypseus]|uniref:DUF4097 family beta strand repeat-containing protein n=1 Tax=Kineococcus gypseus TaxID=1637102 RepID=UPI003D7E87E8